MSAPTPTSTLTAGAVLEGRYRLTEVLGGGGMGQVWAAQHLTLGHHVAIKVLHGSIMSSAEPRARFEREARLMAQLGEASRHITRVIEHGVLSDGVPYLVMEHLRGEDLAMRLKREKVLPLAKVSDLVSQLAKALAAAHAQGVVHRDIKPANVFLTTDEEGHDLVKLLDFGVAKAVADGNEQTMAGQVIGTPNYMAPEQLTGEAAVDHRADLFAVGSVTYRAAVGKSAFGKGSISEMAMRVVSMQPAAPSSVNPALPASFDAFITKCMAKSPTERFQSARELADALAAVAAELGSAAFQVPALFSALETGEMSSLGAGSLTNGLAQSRRPPDDPPPRRTNTALVLGLATLAVAGGVGALLVLTRPAARETTAAPPASVQPVAAPAAPSSTPTVASATPAVSATASAPAASSSAPAHEPPHGRVGQGHLPPSTARATQAAPAAKPAVVDTWNKKDEL
ncbi:MAG: serine/threonine protein kinase [Polyangiaceae bacterium]|nr:serine/threonine protein kinase [Polyangiaceae bacterium]